MTTKIYFSFCSDYFSKTWEPDNYSKQLDVINHAIDKKYLGVRQQEFVSVSLIRRIIEAVKGFFGFENCVDSTKVQAELLKFLYYGATNRFVNQEILEKLKAKHLSSSRVAPAVQELVKEIFHFQTQCSEINKQKSLKRMRVIVVGYHQAHKSVLQPNFWSRLFSSTNSIQVKKNSIQCFGDTPLLLAQQALDNKTPDPHTILQFLTSAHAVHNTTTEFQNKLWDTFKTFLNKYSQHSILTSQTQIIQKMILSMASYALENQEYLKAQDQFNNLLKSYPKDRTIKSRIGEIYLNNKLNKDLEPYLKDLISTYGNDTGKLGQIAQAYISLNRFEEAVQIYLRIIQLYKDETTLSTSLSEGIIAEINMLIGKLYLKEEFQLLQKERFIKVIHYLSEACTHYPRLIEAQTLLFKTYSQALTKDIRSFQISFAEQYLIYLSQVPQQLIESKGRDIHLSLLLLLQHTSPVEIEKAKKYLKCNIQLFIKYPTFIRQTLQFLKTSSHFVDEILLAHLETTFAFRSNMLKNIGDVYANAKQHAKALDCYQRSLSLYESQKPTIKQLVKHHLYLKSIAYLRLKISNYLLDQPEELKKDSKRLEETIELLIKSAEYDSEASKKSLFRAYQLAGDIESTKPAAEQHIEKMIDYYEKADQYSSGHPSIHANLITLYIKKSLDEKLLLLYQRIQSNIASIPLSAELYSALAQKLSASNHPLAAIKCERIACDQQPDNPAFKKNLMDLLYSFVNNTLTNIDDHFKTVDQQIEVLEEISTSLRKVRHSNMSTEEDRIHAKVYIALVDNYKKKAPFLDIPQVERVKRFVGHDDPTLRELKLK